MPTDDCLVAYRHDAHKVLARPHREAPSELGGTAVGEVVPYGADGEAAALSRPTSEPTVTVKNHRARFRLSLLPRHPSPGSRLEPELPDAAVSALFQTDDAEATHRNWLASDAAATFNESIYYPYTSLKYHTLLVAALVDNYRTGTEFDALSLILDPPDRIVPHRTVQVTDRFALRLDSESPSRPCARLGSRPWQSWASTWSRLPEHPLDTGSDRFDMVLDANLRRIGAWSTALQYIEDFQRWRANS